MELTVKLYNDKTSKIGIKYAQEYLAVKAYENLLSENPGSLFLAKIEMVKNKLNLTLENEQTGTKILYKELDYKIDQLKKLFVFVKPGDALLFVHIYNKANTLMIAKPFRTNQFVSLKKIEIVGPNSFENGL